MQILKVQGGGRVTIVALCTLLCWSMGPFLFWGGKKKEPGNCGNDKGAHSMHTHKQGSQPEEVNWVAKWKD